MGTTCVNSRFTALSRLHSAYITTYTHARNISCVRRHNLCNSTSGVSFQAQKFTEVAPLAHPQGALEGEATCEDHRDGSHCQGVTEYV